MHLPLTRTESCVIQRTKGCNSASGDSQSQLHCATSCTSIDRQSFTRVENGRSSGFKDTAACISIL